MCAQILLDHYPDRDLVKLHPEGIGALLEAGCPTDAVVWLDDLNEYLAVDSLRSDWIEMLRDHNNVILATMRLVEWEKYDSQSQLRLPASKVLTAFTSTWLFYDLDEAQRLGESMPSAKAAANVTRYGIGEYLGGGQGYLDRYKAGQAQHPRGVALVRAAVDLRRAGLDPVALSRVEQLAPHYLTTSNTEVHESQDAATTWALALLEGLPGLIEPVDEDQNLVRAGDFILEHLPETGLPGPVWDDVLDGPLTPTETLAVGAFALARDRSRLAIPLFERTLADRERVLGADHPDTLRSRNNLAYAYQSAGDLSQAVPLFEQTLADRERVLGSDHPDTFGSRNNLASAYQSARDLGQAVPLHEQTLADRERVLGSEHPDTLGSRNNLACAYALAGDFERAIPLHQQSITTADRVLGPEHPDTLGMRYNLAGAYALAGDLGQAIPLFKQILAAREQVLGPDHPDTLESRNALANAYVSAGSWDRAIPLFERTLADRGRVLGPEHPKTLSSRSNLAGPYALTGAWDLAIPLFEETLADRERILGPNHPDTLSSRNTLAYAYESVRILKQAIPASEADTTMAEKKNNQTDPTDDGWAKRREGGHRASSTHDTKAAAQAAGRAAAKKDEVEHLIHTKDGTIGESSSHGNDPHPPQD